MLEVNKVMYCTVLYCTVLYGSRCVRNCIQVFLIPESWICGNSNQVQMRCDIMASIVRRTGFGSSDPRFFFGLTSYTFLLHPVYPFFMQGKLILTRTWQSFSLLAP